MEAKFNRLDYKSLIQFLLAEKRKPYEIYRRIFDVYREASFISENIYKSAKHGFATTNLTRKHNLWSGNTLTLR